MRSVKVIYFSPTGTTRKIVETIARGISAESVDVTDITRAGSRICGYGEVSADLTIIGVPVYTGRVPFQAVEVLQHMQADKPTPAVVVVVYGNRAYDDALLELYDISVRAGFIPVAGTAFVGEHSFSSTATPIAVGRPDGEDLEKAQAFGVMIRERIDAIDSLQDLQRLRVPGNFPYRDRAQHVASPTTTLEICTRCGTCEAICPEGIVTVSTGSVSTDETGCILCCACIKNCPTGARHMDDPALRGMAERLSSTCRERKAPEFFMK